MEQSDAVVMLLIDSAVAATEKAGSFLVDAAETALGAVAFVRTARSRKDSPTALVDCRKVTITSC